MSGAYYSEFDAHAAQWLRNLIDAGHITPGVVDERDLREVRAEDVRHCRRFHAFAGIGGWDYALALAGWDATRPVSFTGVAMLDAEDTICETLGASNTQRLYTTRSDKEQAMPPQDTARPSAHQLAGRTFGQLHVLRFLGLRGTGETRHRFWLCRCSCGMEREARGSGLLTGRIASCTACSKKAGYAKASVTMHGRCDFPAFNALFSEYVHNARAKSIEFNISKEDAHRLFESECWYCGSPPTAVKKSKKGHGAYLHNGIDRVDSSLGYVLANVVSCCRTCNYAKRQMSPVEFLAWVERVHAHQQRRNTL